MAFSDFEDIYARIVKAFRASYDGGQAFDAEQLISANNLALLTSSRKETVLAGFRSQLNRQSNWLTDFIRAQTPALKFGVEQIGEPYENDIQAANAIAKFVADTAVSVARRDVTYGANPADNLVGIHRRLTVGVHGEKIESGDHTNPDGITIRIVSTDATGGQADQVEVRYRGNTRESRNNLNIKGLGRVTQNQVLVGPEGGVLDGVNNPNLTGLVSPSDGQDIADGTATTGEITGWDQTRVGAPTVKARPNDAWRGQDYGIGVGGTSASLKIEQPITGWALELGTPVTWMVPAKQSGAGLDADVLIEIGSQNDTFDETALTNGVYVPLLPTFDENLYPDNLDTAGETLAKLTVTLNAGNVGGEEVILGGWYVARMFRQQTGGEYFVDWAREADPVVGTEASYGADSQTDDGEIADMWARANPQAASLNGSGAPSWVLP